MVLLGRGRTLEDTTGLVRSPVGEDIRDRNLLHLVSRLLEVPTLPANVKLVEEIMVGYAIRPQEPVITAKAQDTLLRTAPVPVELGYLLLLLKGQFRILPLEVHNYLAEVEVGVEVVQ